jgi:hypothetical protein
VLSSGSALEGGDDEKKSRASGCTTSVQVTDEVLRDALRLPLIRLIQMLGIRVYRQLCIWLDLILIAKSLLVTWQIQR